MIEQTRNSYVNSDILSDVYHGRIWREFLKVNQSEFLSATLCYGLMLNVDWFQPYDHFTYSIGVIYLVIMNLPRAYRYKRQNVIIVGIIPGPSEPPLSINSYLTPLVTELLQLWVGVQITLPNSDNKIIRAALLAVACDMPASRKVCGFLCHSANLGCNRYYCEFSEGWLQRDYSNFDRPSWCLRSNTKHRQDVQSLLKCTSKSALKHMESQLGCRNSVLLELPYFDPIRMTIIDPMHNLFLGSAKHITRSVFLNKGLLTKSDIDTVHKRVENVQVPIKMGRIPSRIDSGSTFTAEQWMNWTLYYSVYCLHGLLTTDQMECWRAFVLACRRLCKRSLSQDDIKVADLLLITFCKRVTEFITPNMHMHLHLAECLYDFGPLHGFWLYSFERYNGLLGKQPTNNRSIELQLIKRFLKDNAHLDLIDLANKNILLSTHFRDTICGRAAQFQSISSSESRFENCSLQLPTKYTLTVLSDYELKLLREAYAYLHPSKSEILLDERFSLPSTCKKYNTIHSNGIALSSSDSSGGNPGKVPYAYAIPLTQANLSHRTETRPIIFFYFIQHAFQLLDPRSKEVFKFSHIFAVYEWPQHHPSQHVMGKPVEVWCRNLFEATFNCFLPIENIVCGVIVAFDTLEEENVLVVIPVVH